MSESDKPFLCNFQGCGQRFANHDHLSTHQQKHEFSLSLRFRQGDPSLLVDQTPTPTRFLKSCEESGLFQELEEANPFDHDFNKAQPKSSLSESEVKAAEHEEIAPASDDTSRVVVTAIPVAPPANLVNPDKPVPMASAPAHINTASALTKQKLLQTIQMKEQQKILEQTIAQQLGQSPEILAQALKNMMPMSENTLSSDDDDDDDSSMFLTPTDIPARRKRGRKPDDEDPEIKRQRFLERNRAAASRCRAKKKVWVDNLEGKCKEMEIFNQNLTQEVTMLRSEVQQLKSILIAHKDCPLIVQQSHASINSTEASDQLPSSGGVTLLSQLANMPSMSPLITSPVPSVGSVVPNMQNGAPEVAKDIEISDETEVLEQ